MSEEGAIAFLDRVEGDEGFARELESLRDDPPAVVEKIHAAGFNATPDEIRQAFIERYGTELTPEQLDQIAAGVEPGVVFGAGVAAGVVILTAAAAALV